MPARKAPEFWRSRQRGGDKKLKQKSPLELGKERRRKEKTCCRTALLQAEEGACPSERDGQPVPHNADRRSHSKGERPGRTPFSTAPTTRAKTGP